MDKAEIAKALVEKNCISFGEFTLKSGKKSPYYFDLRILPSYPALLKGIVEEMRKKIPEGVNRIGGILSAGVPIASYLSYLTDLPMFYVRKESKEYGKKKMIEGIIGNGDKALLIDDLITDGGSKIPAIKAVEEAGATAEGILVILDREQGGKDSLEKEGCKLYSLMTVTELMDTLLAEGAISKNKYDTVVNYIRNQ
jgi:orotate phosphoribosyltransferase